MRRVTLGTPPRRGRKLLSVGRTPHSGLLVLTDAVRGPPLRDVTSPKKSPCLSTATSLPCWTTVALPSRTTKKNPMPSSPSLRIVALPGQLSSAIRPATFFPSDFVRSPKTFQPPPFAPHP